MRLYCFVFELAKYRKLITSTDLIDRLQISSSTVVLYLQFELTSSFYRIERLLCRIKSVGFSELNI